MSSTALSVPHPDQPDNTALDDLAAKVALLRQTNQKIAKYAKVQAELQHAIKARLGDMEVGTIAGRPVVTWKRTLRVAVSQKLLKQRYPEIASEVCDITEVRTFKVLDQ
jgi:predicted phage-related endonuclease